MNSILAAVSGLKAHQTMIDVAGNNLANLNTTGYKSSRVTFADLFSETLRVASPATGKVGGTNPMQIGSGVNVATIDKNMSQGSLVDTGQPLDLAIEGNGYFVVNDGTQDVYTRAGSFTVDSDYYLVDPSTGYRVQRIGSEGIAEGFQSVTNNAIRIPYDVALAAKATSLIYYNGNVSADDDTVGTTILSATIQYTDGNTTASEDTLLADLDQVTTALVDGDKIIITGKAADGSAVSAELVIDADTTTMGDLIAAISAAFPGSTASISNGVIRLTDDSSGYSQTDLTLSFSGTGKMKMPGYFSLLDVGGTGITKTSIEIFDSQGVSHELSGAFIRTDDTNTWDFVVTDITGDVELVDRRIRGITFLANGAYGGLNSTIGDSAALQMKFAHDPTNTRSINISFGTVGEFDGVTQFGGSSTATAASQDGYESGWLSSLSVTQDGVITATFTNGLERDIAAIKVATFQNPAGLEGIGHNYYVPTGNSGIPIFTKALSGDAGAIRGGSLEKSNVDVAEEFVNLIQAQNGFQANARTITTTNEMLQELANLIR